MNKSESIINLISATLKVMSEVKGIDKTMTIGAGSNAYKGVSDQVVKKIIGESMEKNGLAIFPIGIDETTQLSEWDETGQYGTKRKQSIFTKVTTNYLLTHISGEFMELVGYGHGVDNQDKSAGKATTYALKYALLYTFLIPTGKIDDADNTKPKEEISVPVKKLVKLGQDKFSDAVKFLKNGKTMAELTSFYDVDDDMKFKLTLALEE
jgi:hypothetical protein